MNGTNDESIFHLLDESVDLVVILHPELTHADQGQVNERQKIAYLSRCIIIVQSLTVMGEPECTYGKHVKVIVFSIYPANMPGSFPKRF